MVAMANIQMDWKSRVLEAESIWEALEIAKEIVREEGWTVPDDVTLTLVLRKDDTAAQVYSPDYRFLDSSHTIFLNLRAIQSLAKIKKYERRVTILSWLVHELIHFDLGEDEDLIYRLSMKAILKRFPDRLRLEDKILATSRET